MSDFNVQLYISFVLVLEGILGTPITINMKTNSSVMLRCQYSDFVVRCSCPSYPKNCRCDSYTRYDKPSTEVYKHLDKVFKFIELQGDDSGLYTCYNNRKHGQKYFINVFQDREKSVLIGVLGKSLLMPCAAKQNVSSSEKHWCKVVGPDAACQPVMDLVNETTGDFEIQDINGSFSLEKHQLNYSDSGLYRCVVNGQNDTKTQNDLAVTVQSRPGLFLDTTKGKNPKAHKRLEIACKYTHDFQHLDKYWQCDDSKCPEEGMTITDDRFQSALELSIDRPACKTFQYYTCVAEVVKVKIVHKSEPFRNPFSRKLQDVDININWRERKDVRIDAYHLLKIKCVYTPPRRSWDYDDRYDRYDRPYRPYRPYPRPIQYYDYTITWCKMDAKYQYRCNPMTNYMDKKTEHDSITMQMCVTPGDTGQYRCGVDSHTYGTINIVVIAPPPDPRPRPPPRPPKPPKTTTRRPTTTTRNRFDTPSQVTVGIIVPFTAVLMLLVIITYRRRRILKLNKAPAAEVDVLANEYANSLAQYYSHNRDLPRLDTQATDEHNDTDSTSSEEMIPCVPKAYIDVASGGTAVQMEDNENTSDEDEEENKAYAKLNIRKAAIKIKKTRASVESSLQESNKNKVDDDDYDDVELSYTQVIFKPKGKPK